MPMLLHGTTWQRAESIMREGPDPGFIEPAGVGRAEGFSTCIESGPFPLGRPDDYACLKAKMFAKESGPAILAIEVPDEIIDLATNDFFPRSQGVVQFDDGAGLQELRACWLTLKKEIRSVDCP